MPIAERRDPTSGVAEAARTARCPPEQPAPSTTHNRVGIPTKLPLPLPEPVTKDARSATPRKTHPHPHPSTPADAGSHPGTTHNDSGIPDDIRDPAQTSNTSDETAWQPNRHKRQTVKLYNTRASRPTGTPGTFQPAVTQRDIETEVAHA